MILLKVLETTDGHWIKLLALLISLLLYYCIIFTVVSAVIFICIVSNCFMLYCY